MVLNLLYQSQVSPDPEVNEELTDQQRLFNLEHDIVALTGVVSEQIAQNKKYNHYLDIRIQTETNSALFWVDVRKRLVTAGILGTCTIIGSALIYAFIQWVKHQ